MDRGFLVTFSTAHGARHLWGTGLSAQLVETVIRADLAARLPADATQDELLKRAVHIAEVSIQYHAYVISKGRIHVGTYYVTR